jgi:CHAD domain-containing protein
MTMAEKRYRLASLDAGRSILEQLEERFSVQRGMPYRSIRVYLDTFDWRFHREAAVLMASSEHQRYKLGLVSECGRNSLSCPVDTIPAFANELPVGYLQEAVAPICGIRRLLPLVEVAVESEPARILDERRKTVARAYLERRTVKLTEGQSRDLQAQLRVEPLRGYRQRFEDVADFFETQCNLQDEVTGEFVEALAAVGRKPGDYSSKFRLDLVPEAPAAEEVKRILGVLLDSLLANVEGVREDLDIEFLHDFRVSVRRTRTALSQIRGVVPRSAIDAFKPEFSWLGKLTGPTRDLDVYLMKMHEYRATLPASVSGDLEPMRQFLESHRVVELKKILEGLDSRRFSDLVRGWRSFLDQGPDPDATVPDADVPIRELAAREIRRAYERFMKKGRAIDDDSPPSALHRLRIDGKKLRYLIEFFRSLFDADEMEDLIGALKRVQDNLGDFNDFGVQQRMLAKYGQQMIDEGFTSARALMAMGRLIDKLERGEAAERKRFAKRFRRLDSRKNRRRYEALFKT